MIIFLYGEDIYRAHKQLAKLRAQAEAAKKPQYVEVFDAEDCGVNDVMAAIGSGSLFGKKFIILKDPLSRWSTDDQRLLRDRLETLPEDATLVVFERGEFKKTTVLWKLLSSQENAKEFAVLDAGHLVPAAQKLAASLGIVINSAALHDLGARTGPDFWRIESELQKLSAFTKGKEIAVEHVEQLTPDVSDPNIFATIDAITTGDRQKAIAQLHEYLSLREDEMYLASMITYQFRNVMQVKYLREQGAQKNEIQKQTGLHPFVVDKSIGIARNFSMQELKVIYQKLTDLDVALKTGDVEPTVALDMLVVGLTR